MSSELEEKMEAIYDLPEGPGRVHALEDAINLADALGDLDAATELREDLLRASIFGGLPDRSLVAFSWLRAQHQERHPDQALPTNLLWDMKWVVEELPYFSRISAQQLESALADMEAEYERAQMSPRPVHQHRMMAKMVLGSPPEEIETSFRAWQSGTRDGGADCAACEAHYLTWYTLTTKGLDEALEVGASLLDERLSCWQMPQRTVGMLLIPVFDSGRAELASTLHERFFGSTKGRSDLIADVGAHLEYQVVSGRLEAARATFESELKTALENPEDLRRWPFITGARALCCAWSKDDRPVELRLPIGAMTGPDRRSMTTESLHSVLSTAERGAEGRWRFDPGRLLEAFEAELQATAERADARTAAGAYQKAWSDAQARMPNPRS